MITARWQRITSAGFLVAIGLLGVAIAAAPTTLGCPAIPGLARAAAIAAAVVCLLASGVARRHGVRPAVTTAVALGAGSLYGAALGRIAAAEPWGVSLLLGVYVLLCAVVEGRALFAGGSGVVIGLVLGCLWLPAVPMVSDLTLSVEHNYAGALITPLWLRIDRALAVAALSVAAGGAAVVANACQKSWRTALERYAALGRLLEAPGSLRTGQAALAVAALADPRWSLTGVGVVEWDTLRLIVVRGAGDWRQLASTLHDAVIPLAQSGNPLVRAARVARRVEITAGHELLDGMWRSFGSTERQCLVSTPMHGWALPLRTIGTSSVLFAVSADQQVDFDWLDDLAGALSVLGAIPPAFGLEPALLEPTRP